MRGVFLKDSSFAALALPLGILVLMAVVVFGAAIMRFRRDLAPRRVTATDTVEATDAAEVAA